MLERLEAERRSAASAALSAQERERARVARDLHDEVNQALTGLLLRLEALRRGTDDPERSSAELAETSALASRAMRGAARPRPAPAPDDARRPRPEGRARRRSSRRSTAAAGIAAGFEAEGDLDDLPEEVQLVTYRVAQEAVTNVDPARARPSTCGCG